MENIPKISQYVFAQDCLIKEMYKKILFFMNRPDSLCP